MATTAHGTDRPTTTHVVRVDLLVGAGLIMVTAVGRLLWQAADAGLFDTFGTR
jgi:hypothetical protein